MRVEVEATQAGIRTYDDRYGRFGPAALAPHLAALKSLAAALEETTADALDDEIDRTALLNDARTTLHRFERERRQATNPEFWLSHLLGGLHALMVRDDRSTVERARALLGRLDDIPAFLDDAREALDRPVGLFVETATRVNEAGAADLAQRVLEWDYAVNRIVEEEGLAHDVDVVLRFFRAVGQCVGVEHCDRTMTAAHFGRASWAFRNMHHPFLKVAYPDWDFDADFERVAPRRRAG